MRNRVLCKSVFIPLKILPIHPWSNKMWNAYLRTIILRPVLWPIQIYIDAHYVNEWSIIRNGVTYSMDCKPWEQEVTIRPTPDLYHDMELVNTHVGLFCQWFIDDRWSSVHISLAAPTRFFWRFAIGKHYVYVNKQLGLLFAHSMTVPRS